MSEPKLISPMLDNFVMGDAMSSHHGICCYPAMPKDSNDKYIVKVISVPASQVQLDALLLTGAYQTQEQAREYFHSLAEEILQEVSVLGKLSGYEGFLPYQASQMVEMDRGVGYNIYLLSPYKRSLERFCKKNTVTHLHAVNLGLDLCASMAVCRKLGYLYLDLKPSNIFVSKDNEFRVGDLGFVALDSLKFASMPDKYRSSYTAPEIADAFSSLNTTVDIYAIGMILYQLYNDGKLPKVTQEPLDPPAYADYEMAEIILKACAYKPEDRWQDPIAMGEAIVSYMQRNGVNDVPIVAPIIIPAAEIPAVDPETPADGDEVRAEAAAPAEDETPADGDGAPAEAAPPADDAAPAEDETPADGEAAPAEGFEQIVLDDKAFTGGDDAGEDAAADGADGDTGDAASDDDLTDLGYLDDLESDDLPADDQLSIDPGYFGLSGETSDILAQADELLSHDVPQAVITTKPVEVPVPAPIFPAAEEPAAEGEAEDESPAAGEDKEAPPAPIVPAAEEEAGDENEDEDEEKPPREPIHIPVKKIVTTVLAVALLAGLIFGGYWFYTHYYLQTIEDITITGDENSLTVSITSDIDEALLQIVCTDTYGQRQVSPVENGTARFTDLNSNTLYTIQVEIEGFHQLNGKISGSYTTPSKINILSFSAITGSEDGSAVLRFTMEGMEPDVWTLNYSAEGEEMRSIPFSGHMVTVTGLTIGKEYTFTLSTEGGHYIVGQNTLNFVANDLTYAQDLTITSCSSNCLSATWAAPEGKTVGQWTVRCYNDSGYDQTLTTSDCYIVFPDVDCAKAYTVEVTAENMTVSSRTYVSADSITILNPTVQATTTSMQVEWDFEGTPPAGDWLLLYTINGGAYQEVTRTDETLVTISPVVPGGEYAFTLQTESGVTVFEASFTASVPEAETFTGYGVKASQMRFGMCLLEDVEKFTLKNWQNHPHKDNKYLTNEFAPGSQVAIPVRLKVQYNTSSNKITTLFVIRDAEQNIISTTTSTRTWTSMWYAFNCTLELPMLPEAPGEYTVEIYFNGQYVTILPFKVVANS